MKILIPVNDAEVALLPLHTSVILYFGGLENHQVTFIPTPSQLTAAHDAANRLKAICPKVSVEAMQVDPLPGEPKARNSMFSFAMQRMTELRNTLPIFWMELKCLPVRRWADPMAAGYATVDKACVGAIFPTLFPEPTGKMTTHDGDFTMARCGMYPPDFIQKTRLWKDLGVASTSTPEPFNRYLRHEMAMLGMGNTNLIANRGLTNNYQPDLSCQNANPDKGAPDLSENDVSNAVVIYGCEDESLAKLVLAGEFKAPEPASGPTGRSGIPGPDVSIVATGVSETRVAEMLKEFKKDFLADLKDILKQPVAAVPATTPPVETAEGIWPKIRQMLDLQKWTLSDLSEAAELPKENLKELLSGKGYEVKQGGWIKEMEPATA